MKSIENIGIGLIEQGKQAKRDREAFERSLDKNPPPSSTCPRHNVSLGVDKVRSWRMTRELGEQTISHFMCADCYTEEWLSRVGVPANLLHCSFTNFKSKSDAHTKAAADALMFSTRKTGVLQLLGPVGTGKTHLAIAIMRAVKAGRIITQLALLNSVRERYRNDYAPDMVKKCKETHLLVLDEVGLSVGGRDELPMLHDILSHRIGEKMRTVITGNIKPENLIEVFGERVVDRLRESTVRVCLLTGESERRVRRAEYLKS